jgi:hypothetical protein
VKRTLTPSAEIEAQIDQLLAVGVGENPRESLPELAKLARIAEAHGKKPGDVVADLLRDAEQVG